MKVQLMVLMEAFDHLKKRLKANTKFCLNLHYNAKFIADNKNVNFPTQFCLGSISNGFNVTESREVFLNGNV